MTRVGRLSRCLARATPATPECHAGSAVAVPSDGCRASATGMTGGCKVYPTPSSIVYPSNVTVATRTTRRSWSALGAGPLSSLLVLLFTVACAGRAPAERPPAERPRAIAPPVRDELDPLGFVVEYRAELGLGDEQIDAIRGLRASARARNRTDLARLDSLDYALGGRLGPWLREARGGARPRRRWTPKLLPAQRDTLARILQSVRERDETAECQLAALLTGEQRAALARLDSLYHRAPARGRRPAGGSPGGPSEGPTRGAAGSAACADPLPYIRGLESPDGPLALR